MTFQVRDAAFRTIRGFLGKLEKVSEDPSLKEGMGEFMINSLRILQLSLYGDAYIILYLT